MSRNLPRNEAARVQGMLTRVEYPLGKIELEYKLVDMHGGQSSETHILKLLLSGDEARQMANQFSLFASKIDALGGSKQ